MPKGADLRMAAAIFALLLLTVGWMHCVQSALPVDLDFSCQRNATPHAINLTALAGYWYEAVRAPNVDGMICLNVSVPATLDAEANDLQIQLEYVNTLGKKPQPIQQTIAFPWDAKTANGTFVVVFSNPTLNISVIYEVVYSDPELMTILCGYSGISPMPLFKLLTRQRQLDPFYVDYINSKLTKAGLAGNFIWTDQSPDRCNAALRSAAEAFTTFFLAVACLAFRCS